MVRLGRIRVVCAVVGLCCLAVLGASYVAGQQGNEVRGTESAVETALDENSSDTVVAPRPNATVVTADSAAVLSDEGDSPRSGSELIAFSPDGSIGYTNDTRTRYWDVDPVDGTDATVEYVFSDHLPPVSCPGEGDCTRNGVERLNLTTGDVTTVFTRFTPDVHATRWHDVDRIGPTRLLVADIYRDRAFVVDTATNETTWQWNATTDLDTDDGGPYPDDWTHINDVEYVELDGEPTVMVSVRNHDQVVFLDMETGLRENWTLGADGDHGTLYEQHNPDYIPASRGGPAVLVADSENGRVVEYQRENGSWEQSWEWQDPRLTWPRDADRLPNGHTLVTDSNGDRLVEVDEGGGIVWSADLGFPYEAERLATGDESQHGESAAAVGLEGKSPDAVDRSPVDDAAATAPAWLVNAIAYVRPGWVGTTELLAAAGLVGTLSVWGVAEFRRAVALRRS